MSQKKIKLAVSGGCGKMGKRIIALAEAINDLELVAALEDKSHPAIGKKLSEIIKDPVANIKISADPEIIGTADVLIEFTSPMATIAHLSLAVRYKKAVVIGTTGLLTEQLEQIRASTKSIPIVFSPNMSWGVNLVFRLVQEAAQRLGKGYKVNIKEAHHVHKKDAPSGTAKRLAQLVQQQAVYKDKNVNIESVREGEIVGEHQICFDGPQDIIVIKHSAKTRDIFAQGALQAALFAVKQKPGLYDMQDVIVAR